MMESETEDDIVARLEHAAAPIDALWHAANEMAHVADRIKGAVNAPFRPAWADPLQSAKELCAEQGSLLRGYARHVRELHKLLEEVHAPHPQPKTCRACRILGRVTATTASERSA